MVFPGVLNTYATPAGSRFSSRQGSSTDLGSSSLKPQFGLFDRIAGSFSSLNAPPKGEQPLDGPVEEIIAAGVAFGKNTC